MSMTADRKIDQFEVSLANEQASHAVNEPQLIAAAQAVLDDSDFQSASLSIAIVDDATMQALNRQYLNHDYPTDVLSFALEDDGQHLEGEIIVSADTAASAAAEHGTTAASEQLLYVIHGTLHLIGYGDKLPEEADAMCAAEARFLKLFFPLPVGEGRGEGVLSNPESPSPCPLPEGEGSIPHGADRR
jgi:probable rRNA maturation factor